MINKSGLMLKDYKKFAGRRREKAARGYDKIFTVFYMLDRVYAGNYGLSMINPQEYLFFQSCNAYFNTAFIARAYFRFVLKILSPTRVTKRI
jgi:hypothetical protein